MISRALKSIGGWITHDPVLSALLLFLGLFALSIKGCYDYVEVPSVNYEHVADLVKEHPNLKPLVAEYMADGKLTCNEVDRISQEQDRLASERAKSKLRCLKKSLAE